MSLSATQLSGVVSGDATSWRQAAFQRIQKLGMPHAKQEIWRYAPLEPLLKALETSTDVSAFIDGLMEMPNEENVFVPLTQLSYSTHTQLTEQTEQRLNIVFEKKWQQQVLSLSTRPNTNVTLSLTLDTKNGGGHVLCYLDVAENVHVTLEIIGQGLTQPVMLTLRSKQSHNSTLNMVSYIEDSAWARLDIGHRILGHGATMALNCLSLVRQHQYVGTITNVRHEVGDSTSSQRVKSVLYDHALSEYSGSVYVAPHAQKTDSVQSNPNLVLSDTARALSRPQLHIYADDVKCAHGATMGQLDPEPLFYLASRGFSHAEAISMVLAGFAEEIIDHFSNPTERSALLANATGFMRHAH